MKDAITGEGYADLIEWLSDFAEPETEGVRNAAISYIAELEAEIERRDEALEAVASAEVISVDHSSLDVLIVLHEEVWQLLREWERCTVCGVAAGRDEDGCCNECGGERDE